MDQQPQLVRPSRMSMNMGMTGTANIQQRRRVMHTLRTVMQMLPTPHTIRRDHRLTPPQGPAAHVRFRSRHPRPARTGAFPDTTQR